MKQPFQFEFAPVETLNGQQTYQNVIRFPAPVAGVLTDFRVRKFFAGGRPLTFEVQINGVNLWTGGSRPSLGTDDLSAAKNDLDIEVALGDIITVSAAGIYQEITQTINFQFDFDDGTGGALPYELGIAVSDETSDLTTSNTMTFRSPVGFNLTSLLASLTAESTGGVVTVKVYQNGENILAELIQIDENEKTSETATNPFVLITTPTVVAFNDEFLIETTAAGTGAKALKLWFIGTRT